MAEPSAVPDCLTIEEAARVLRMSRTTAYEQARVYRATDGKAGLPNFGVGGCFRVPTAALERMLGRPVTRVPDPKGSKAAGPQSKSTVAAGGEVRQLRARKRPSAGAAVGQAALPL